MRTLVTVLLFIFSPVVFSADSGGTDAQVRVLLSSYHWSNKTETRNDTYGLNVTYKAFDVYLYRNSFGQMTQAFGYKKSWLVVDHVSVAITTGVVYGYGYEPGNFAYSDASNTGGRRVMPFIIPTITIDYNHVLFSAHIFAAGAAFSVGVEF